MHVKLTTLVKDNPCVRTPLTDIKTDPTHGILATLSPFSPPVVVDCADISGGGTRELLRRPFVSFLSHQSFVLFLLFLLSLIFFFFFHLTYSRWTSSLPSYLWSQRIFPSLPGSRLTIFLSRCKFSTLTTRQLMLNFTYSRFHAFRYERKNTNPTLVRIELTTSILADVQLTY